MRLGSTSREFLRVSAKLPSTLMLWSEVLGADRQASRGKEPPKAHVGAGVVRRGEGKEEREPEEDRTEAQGRDFHRVSLGLRAPTLCGSREPQASEGPRSDPSWVGEVSSMDSVWTSWNVLVAVAPEPGRREVTLAETDLRPPWRGS